eukprot:scaffold1637_cov66-Phaeocystis_antarctica.AAC.2
MHQWPWLEAERDTLPSYGLVEGQHRAVDGEKRNARRRSEREDARRDVRVAGRHHAKARLPVEFRLLRQHAGVVVRSAGSGFQHTAAGHAFGSVPGRSADIMCVLHHSIVTRAREPRPLVWERLERRCHHGCEPVEAMAAVDITRTLSNQYALIGEGGLAVQREERGSPEWDHKEPITLTLLPPVAESVLLGNEDAECHLGLQADSVSHGCHFCLERGTTEVRELKGPQMPFGKRQPGGLRKNPSQSPVVRATRVRRGPVE